MPGEKWLHLYPNPGALDMIWHFFGTRTSPNLVPPSLVYKFLETNPLLQYYTILVGGLEHFFSIYWE